MTKTRQAFYRMRQNRLHDALKYGGFYQIKTDHYKHDNYNELTISVDRDEINYYNVKIGLHDYKFHICHSDLVSNIISNLVEYGAPTKKSLLLTKYTHNKLNRFKNHIIKNKCRESKLTFKSTNEMLNYAKQFKSVRNSLSILDWAMVLTLQTTEHQQ